jgi:cysteinyl-tRNA synthetase
MEVGYLRNLGMSVPSGSGTGPVVLRQDGFKGSAASAAPVQNGSSRGGSTAAAAYICRPCLDPLPGFAKVPVKRDGHPEWLQPTDGVDVGLKAINSLTGEKEVFRPMEGRKIRWYTCGPTVYDVSHMGHARAYLTFDILRRIMADYFKYELKYQINITDIDDKIILRSRQNKLFDDFSKEAESMTDAECQKAVESAMKIAEDKLLAKRPAAPEGKASEKDKQEYDKLLQEHQLKVGQFGELKSKVAAARSNKKSLLAAAREPLMAKLDKERGHTVTDHAIFNAHARHFEDEYFEDMDNLGILRPDVVTRISDFMDGQVQVYIEKLEDDGFAYASAGSVYFDIDSFNRKGFTYRKLCPCVQNTSAAEMEEGEGALATTDGEKRNPNDFALWKKSKPGEPAWDSRWGPGRPGWHIECSVMATSILKEFVDIHGGGEDLKFPHHDNEMAQTEAYLGRQQWVNYFWHAGHLHIQGLKMSKSLKNFITIRQAMEVHTARQLRLMFLMQRWDMGMNYSDDAINMAKEVERKVKHCLGSLRFHRRREHSKSSPGKREQDLEKALDTAKKEIDAALKDNFNTSKAIDLISRIVTQCYESYSALPEASLEPVGKVCDFVVEILGIFGVDNLTITREKEADWIPALDAFAGLREDVRRLAREKAGNDKVKEAIAKAKPACIAASSAGLGELSAAFDKFMVDLAGFTQPKDLLMACDEVRDKTFVDLGVRLEDLSSSGFIWMFDDTKTMVSEAKEAAEEKSRKALEKVQRSLDEKVKALGIAEKAAVVPANLFKTGTNVGLYTEFDENGLPTKLASGDEISKSKAKDFKKDMDKQKKEYEKLQKQAGDAGIDAYLTKLRKEVSDMEKQLADKS